jgi:hypothetical protein
MKRSLLLAATVLVTLAWLAPVGGGDKKEKFDPAIIKKLQATLPDGWKDDGAALNVRRFIKDSKPKLLVFAELYKDEAPKSAEALADLAKKDNLIFPRGQWVSTKGVGKLPDGVFVVGVSKTAGAEEDAIGAVRTIGGKTVMFICVPAGEAADRKEMLGVVRSAKFEK